MDLLALLDFHLVARHGGFGRAARATDRPKTTLSRRVAALEMVVGVRLFERGARAPKLTVEGQELYERTAGLLAEIDDAVAAVAAGTSRLRGPLRISAPLLFAQTVMGRLTAGFVLRHPEILVDVRAEDRAVDMVEEGFDLVIRVNPSRDTELVGRCFLRDRMIVVAAPMVTRPDLDEPVPAVLLGSADAVPWQINGPDGLRHVRFRPVLRLSSLVMVHDAVRTGAGAALLPLSMVGGDIASGRLVEWGSAAARKVELWALYPSRRLLSTRVSAFLDYLAQTFPNGEPDELALFMNRT